MGNPSDKPNNFFLLIYRRCMKEIQGAKHMNLVILVPLFYLLDMLFNQITSVRPKDNSKSHSITNETSILIFDGRAYFGIWAKFTNETLAETESLTLADKESLSSAGNELRLSFAENESYLMATNDSESALAAYGHLLTLHFSTFVFIFLILTLMLIILSPWKSLCNIFPWYVTVNVLAFVSLSIPPLFRLHFSLTHHFQLLFLRFIFFTIISAAFFVQIEHKHRTRTVKFAILTYLFLSIISPYTAALEFSITKYALIAFLLSLSVTDRALRRTNSIIQFLILSAFIFIHICCLYFQSTIIDNVDAYVDWEDVWRKNFCAQGFSAQRVLLLLAIFLFLFCSLSEGAKKMSFEHELRRRKKWKPPSLTPEITNAEHARKRLVKIINSVCLAKTLEFPFRIFLFLSLAGCMWAIFCVRLAFYRSLDLQSLMGGIYYSVLLEQLLKNNERYAEFIKYIKVVARVNSRNRSSRCRDYVSAECSVCNEPVDYTNRYVMTPCNHHFHKSCLLAQSLTCNKCHKCKMIAAFIKKPTRPVNSV